MTQPPKETKKAMRNDSIIKTALTELKLEGLTKKEKAIVWYLFASIIIAMLAGTSDNLLVAGASVANLAIAVWQSKKVDINKVNGLNDEED